MGCDDIASSKGYPGIRIQPINTLSPNVFGLHPGGDAGGDHNSNIINSRKNFNKLGRVEVRKNGIWGSICNDNTDENNWSGSLSFGSGPFPPTDNATQTVDDRLAEVVCRQLGYRRGRLLERSIVPNGTNQIWMDNVNCPDWPTTRNHVEQCHHND